MRLTDLERPFIATAVTDRSIPEAVTTIKQAEYAGTRAFDVYLPLLGFPDAGEMSQVAAATPWPLYATCRPGGFYELFGVEEPVDLTEKQRTDVLVEAVEAGLDGVDFELDTFDRTGGPEHYTADGIADYADDPEAEMAEITDDPDAVGRQRELVDRVHDAGGEVIISCHTCKHITPEDAVAIAERIEDRGADFAKIVGFDRDVEDLLDTLEAHLALNESVDVPYALMAVGDVSRIGRPLAPMFGSAWVFAQPELRPGGFHTWPLVDNARELLRRVDWRMAHDPHSD